VDERALRGFIEAETGGRVTRFERTAAGASRGTWLVDVERDGEPPAALVLRHDTGDGPLSGTELDLTREAVVYRALRDSPVRIPRLLACSEDGGALLVERAPGSERFAEIPEVERRDAVARDYFEALAELHRLDAAKLALPGIARPADARDHARADLRLWLRIFTQRVAGPTPLIDLAFRWLEAAAPAGAEKTALCHGDAGPGNFLFEGTRVTALLDWEFAHLGDPLDDLAWIAVRAQLLGGFGDLAAGFATWRDATGLSLSPERIEYYRALVLVRMATSCLVGLAHAGERAMDATVYALLLPYLRLLIPQALKQSGCDDPGLADLEERGRRAIQESPILREHARDLDPLCLP
jgi:aminoglycoside phosphotransferase (APT) family kinase protein